MSYILEALRKSERERQAGQAAPLVPIPLDQAPPRRHGLAWAATFLILLNGTVLGYLWLTRWPSKEPATQRAPTASTEHAAEARIQDREVDADLVEPFVEQRRKERGRAIERVGGIDPPDRRGRTRTAALGVRDVAPLVRS